MDFFVENWEMISGVAAAVVAAVVGGLQLAKKDKEAGLASKIGNFIITLGGLIAKKKKEEEKE